MTLKLIKIAKYDRNNFFLMAGPCAIEERDLALRIAENINTICTRLEIPYIFKGSYRKAYGRACREFWEW